MQKQKPWREHFSQDAKVDTRPPTTGYDRERDGKLKLRIPQEVTNQTMARGHSILIGKVQGARSNIDDFRRWTKFKWKFRGSLDIIALPNDYVLFIFGTEEGRNEILSST